MTDGKQNSIFVHEKKLWFYGSIIASIALIIRIVISLLIPSKQEDIKNGVINSNTIIFILHCFTLLCSISLFTYVGFFMKDSVF